VQKKRLKRWTVYAMAITSCLLCLIDGIIFKEVGESLLEADLRNIVPNARSKGNDTTNTTDSFFFFLAEDIAVIFNFFLRRAISEIDIYECSRYMYYIEVRVASGM
jgi:hypothetical protein